MAAYQFILFAKCHGLGCSFTKQPSLVYKRPWVITHKAWNNCEGSEARNVQRDCMGLKPISCRKISWILKHRSFRASLFWGEIGWMKNFGEKMEKNFLECVWLGGKRGKKMVRTGCFFSGPIKKFCFQMGKKTKRRKRGYLIYKNTHVNQFLLFFFFLILFLFFFVLSWALPPFFHFSFFVFFFFSYPGLALPSFSFFFFFSLFN